MKKKINIGFDIGITSVGWAIVDEDNNIIDRGVRLFEELKNPKDGKLKNQERREKRSARRMISRRKNRKDDFIKLLTRKYFDIFKIEELDNFNHTKNNFIKVAIEKNQKIPVIDMILEGLKTEISPLILARVLYYYLSHRGYSYMSEEQWEKKNGVFDFIKNNSKYMEFANWYESNFPDGKDRDYKNPKELKEEIKTKAKLFNYQEDMGIKNINLFISHIKEFNKEKEYLNKLPSEIQKMEFQKYKYLRGNTINSSFSKYQWKEEIEILLGNQSYLTKEFKEDYFNIFQRVRDFSQGPGSQKSPTDFGLWRNISGEVKKEKENLWDYRLGKCSVFPKEPRANKKSCSAEISNILNQLNTIEIENNNRNNNKLTENEKKEIIFQMISKSGNPLKIISNISGSDITNIYKYPVKEKKQADKSKETENLEKLQNTRTIFKCLSKELTINDYDSFIKHKEIFNDIVDVFSKYPKQFEKIEIELQKIKLNQVELSKTITKDLIKNKIDSQSTNSMSLKALDLYIKEEIRDNGKTLNQKYKNKIEENEMNRFNFLNSNSKYMNLDCLDNDDFIISPTTKCSFREVLKVFNKILKRYVYNPSNHTKKTYELKNIVMEMPTEWNSVDERKRITELQKHNEETKKIVKEKYEYEGNDKTIIQKLVLLSSQEGVDVYSGDYLDPKLVIDDPNYSEIDHIIPWSISYDDSINNKVLVTRESNQAKGRKTPREYLGSNFFKMMKKWEDLFINNEKTANKKKFKNLSIDIGSDEIRRFAGFVGRNLADTRYACRIVKQALNSWLNTENIKNILCKDNEVNIITVNGKYTQQFRKQKYLDIQKNREDYSHHAIDATICAILGNSVEDMGKLVYFKQINENTGEIEVKNKFISYFNKETKSNIKWKELSDSVRNKDVKFSYKINKKSNFGFWGDSIISVKKVTENGKETYKQIYKINLLDELPIDTKTKLNLFEELNQKYENGKKYPDPKLWNDLLAAYNEGMKIKNSAKEFEKKNPFELYMQEYCKQNNLGDYSKSKYVGKILLSRKKEDGSDYKYMVSHIKDTKKINSFSKVKRNSSDTSFGAFVGFDWKEIRIFKDNKDKYRVIPMAINLYKNHLKNEINIKEYNELLTEYNIKNKNYFLIHKGTLMVEKNNPTNIWKVNGGVLTKNTLDVKEIYKKSERSQIGINKIMKNFSFVNVDELGNISLINLEKYLK